MKKINKVKNHINKLLPNANQIEVKVEEVPTKGYKSFIQVDAPQKKKIVALKVDKTINKSLDRSLKAITRQINRIKNKRPRKYDKSYNLYQNLV